VVSGLLIVNADDWGASERTTESIAACFVAGGVTSATAMMHMADSERAAARALELGLPTGLHLNLTQPYDGPAVQARAREMQARVVARFGHLRRRDRLLLNLAQWRSVRYCVEDQLECFRRLYEREPTHVDGHNHVHLNPAVLLAIPAHLHVRTATHPPTPCTPIDLARLARHAAIRARYGSTNLVFDVTAVHPRLGGSGLERCLAIARRRSLELITHPAHVAQAGLLRSPEWIASIADLRLGTFEDLS
jgi:chitin disaccharide deacetylase